MFLTKPRKHCYFYSIQSSTQPLVFCSVPFHTSSTLYFFSIRLHPTSTFPFSFSPSYQITVLEEEQETVCQIYNLINMYSIPIPPEDLVVFATLQPSVNSLHSIIDEAAAERDSSMDKFCASLHKDIKELNHEVMKIKFKSQVHGKPLLPIYQPKNT